MREDATALKSCNEKQPGSLWRPKFRRTEVSEAARRQLKADGLVSLGSWVRLYALYNGSTYKHPTTGELVFEPPNPGRQGQRLIKRKKGWVWTCFRCKREADGKEGVRPPRCPYCKASGRNLVGQETLTFYLRDAHGSSGPYDGGIGLVETLASMESWATFVADWPVSRALLYWAAGLSYARIGTLIGHSREYARLSVQAFHDEWERS